MNIQAQVATNQAEVCEFCRFISPITSQTSGKSISEEGTYCQRLSRNLESGIWEEFSKAEAEGRPESVI